MQSSGDAGVIIFSMGSYINSMDTDKANMIADAFAKLPQKVLWKLAGQPPSKIPPNVKISKWLPQNDLLGELLEHLHDMSFYYSLVNLYSISLTLANLGQWVPRSEVNNLAYNTPKTL